MWTTEPLDRANLETSARKRIIAAQRDWLGARNEWGGDATWLNAVYDARLGALKVIDPN